MRDPKDTVLKLLETNPDCIGAADRTTVGQTRQFSVMTDGVDLVLSQSVVMHSTESTDRLRS